MDSPNSHSFQGTIETSEIETEILDDYPHEKIFSKQASDDENSLHAGETLLMPIVRSRSSSNSDAYQDIDPNQFFDQQGSTTGQRKLITSSHTPAANIILNLGDRLRTNLRSLVNRRENAYASHDSEMHPSYPIQFRNRRSSNNDTFSTIPNDVVHHHKTSKPLATPCAIYDGSETYGNDLNPMESKSIINRSPSFGSTLSVNSNKRRLRSCSEVRGRSNIYEEKE